MDVSSARRRFFLQAVLLLAFAVALLWAVVLRDWWMMAMGAIALPLMIGRLVDAFKLAWPGSRLRSYSPFPRFRLSNAQGIVVGSALFIPMVALLAILDGGPHAVAFGA